MKRHELCCIEDCPDCDEPIREARIGSSTRLTINPKSVIREKLRHVTGGHILGTARNAAVADHYNRKRNTLNEIPQREEKRQ